MAAANNNAPGTASAPINFTGGIAGPSRAQSGDISAFVNTTSGGTTSVFLIAALAFVAWRIWR
jgi:hypothetical protein